jgi:hypothetical protein
VIVEFAIENLMALSFLVVGLRPVVSVDSWFSFHMVNYFVLCSFECLIC